MRMYPWPQNDPMTEAERYEIVSQLGGAVRAAEEWRAKYEREAMIAAATRAHLTLFLTGRLQPVANKPIRHLALHTGD